MHQDNRADADWPQGAQPNYKPAESKELGANADKKGGKQKADQTALKAQQLKGGQPKASRGANCQGAGEEPTGPPKLKHIPMAIGEIVAQEHEKSHPGEFEYVMTNLQRLPGDEASILRIPSDPVRADGASPFLLRGQGIWHGNPGGCEQVAQPQSTGCTSGVTGAARPGDLATCAKNVL